MQLWANTKDYSRSLETRSSLSSHILFLQKLVVSGLLQNFMPRPMVSVSCFFTRLLSFRKAIAAIMLLSNRLYFSFIVAQLVRSFLPSLILYPTRTYVPIEVLVLVLYSSGKNHSVRLSEDISRRCLVLLHPENTNKKWNRHGFVGLSPIQISPLISMDKKKKQCWNTTIRPALSWCS